MDQTFSSYLLLQKDESRANIWNTSLICTFQGTFNQTSTLSICFHFIPVILHESLHVLMIHLLTFPFDFSFYNKWKLYCWSHFYQKWRCGRTEQKKKHEHAILQTIEKVKTRTKLPGCSAFIMSLLFVFFERFFWFLYLVIVLLIATFLQIFPKSSFFLCAFVVFIFSGF